MTAGVPLADYDAVVSDIYDSALSPAHWEVALTSLVNRFGRDRWDIAMLVWERIAPPAGRFVGASGVHIVAQQGYVHEFAGNNAWSVRGHGLPVGSVVHSDQLVEREAFCKTPFFTEFLTRFDLEVGVLALLDRHDAEHLCLCMPGPDNGAPDQLEAVTRLLIPHIQRSVRISRRIGEAELSASSARAVLDAAPSAVLMCDGALRMTYANPQGQTLLREGYLALRSGRLLLPNLKVGAQLKTLAQPGTPRRCAAFSLESDGKTPVAAVAVRIEDRPGAAINPDFGAPQIMIVASSNHMASFANVDFLRDWFALTPAEARLAATIAEGGSLDDFALTRGVSANAARFLLKGVFAKTDTNRQSQLVARLQATPLQWHIGNTASDLPSPIG
jgi:DNA-binding CsgD family transcriptional regulator/PAS domain-containing protein